MPVTPVVRVPHVMLATAVPPESDFGVELASVVADLIDTMNSSPGCVGLAATQIGRARRVAVIDLARHRKPIDHHGLLVFVNPEVIASGEPITAREGCMSVPDFTGDVTRSNALTLSWSSVDGEEHTDDFSGFEARAVQHEVDHLDGLLFLDRVVGREAVFRRRVYK